MDEHAAAGQSASLATYELVLALASIVWPRSWMSTITRRTTSLKRV